ncbi:hypothetical protein JKF63_04634 [Porcisia hertigi]|uniref:Structure-specific endonuclease subunit SLX1 homolog n=1 Tax=Porcisia hertigi TaxID=2761500 RepID=A0A836L8V3_9TRYP|nr:hypothetical protein JKF63_04634 [Porcisia hertigi]
MDTRFHCVYLLTSLDPQCEGDFYIGYTVNPLRRLRQHNGELVNGARRTGRRGRPWTIVCCVSGFTDDRAALKFEWCWQHPTASARLKHTIDVFTGLHRLPYAVATLHFLVCASLFRELDLTLHIFEPALLQEATARAEVFLATRRGAFAVGVGRRADSPQASTRTRSQVFDSVQGQAGGSVTPPLAALGPQGGGLQDAPLTSAPGATTATFHGLPPFSPSLLFHVEVTTRQAFEDAYLSHDRCLLLPSLGPGVDLGEAGKESSTHLSANASASCPYDVSLLSHAVRAEWSNASFAYDSDDEGTRRLAPSWCTEGSGTPSPQRGGAEALPAFLGYRSEERSGDGVLQSSPGDSVGCGPASRSFSRSPPPPASSRRSPSCPSLLPGINDAAPLAADVHRDGVTTFRPPSAAASVPEPRIPLRFADYSEVDFARAHEEEQRRLHLGLLPCSICALPLQPSYVAYCSRAPFCALRCHLSCLAMWMLYAEAEAAATEDGAEASPAPPPQAPPVTMSPLRRLIPSKPCPCPLCGVFLNWGSLVKALKRRVVVERRLHAAQRCIRMEQRWQARLAHINSAKRSTGAAMRRRQWTRVGGAVMRRKSAGGAPVAASTAPMTTINPRPVLGDAPLVPSPNSLANPPLPPPPSSVASALGASLLSPTASSPASLPIDTYSPITWRAGDLNVGAALSVAPPVSDASLLSLTDFCEDDWLRS